MHSSQLKAKYRIKQVNSVWSVCFLFFICMSIKWHFTCLLFYLAWKPCFLRHCGDAVTAIMWTSCSSRAPSWTFQTDFMTWIWNRIRSVVGLYESDVSAWNLNIQRPHKKILISVFKLLNVKLLSYKQPVDCWCSQWTVCPPLCVILSPAGDTLVLTSFSSWLVSLKQTKNKKKSIFIF